MYLIVAKVVPFAVSTALSFLTTVHSAILIRSQLEYDRGRAYTDSGHVFILAISHAHHFPDDIQIYTHTRALYTLRADTQPVIYMYTLPTTPSAQSAVLPGPSCELCTAGYVSARDFQFAYYQVYIFLAMQLLSQRCEYESGIENHFTIKQYVYLLRNPHINCLL